MCKFDRKYAFWFSDSSTYMFGGEVVEVLNEGYVVKPRVNSDVTLYVKEAFIIVPYDEGLKMHEDLAKSQRDLDIVKFSMLEGRFIS